MHSNQGNIIHYSKLPILGFVLTCTNLKANNVKYNPHTRKYVPPQIVSSLCMNVFVLCLYLWK